MKILGNSNRTLQAVWTASSLLGAVPVFAQQPVSVPSGQPVTLFEVLVDDEPGEVWLRFRFIAPDIAGDTPVTHEAAAADMDDLCRNLALPYMAEYELDAARVVISLSDRETEFGAADPEVTQFFELYRPEGDTCIWEGF